MTGREDFGRAVGDKAERKRRARSGHDDVWFWLGMFGLVGWSVAIPTVAGVFLGRWLDERLSDPVSWTLTFLLLGVVVGCANAWLWVRQQLTHRDRREEDP